MSLRLFLSSLGSADARRGATRALLAVCAAGYVLTLAVMAAAGTGLGRWFFVLLVWALMVYVPLRIGLEAMQTIAPAMRARLVAQAGGRADRYGTRSSIELLVDGLFADTVIMPRIATPTQSSKAREGAVAILLRGGDGARGIPIAVRRCLAAVEQWMADITDWSAHHAPANIQARWADLRALTGLIAATKVLVAAHRDRLGRPFGAGALDGDAAADVYLDTCLDSCDRLALEVDVAPWDSSPLALDVDRARRDTLRDAWKAFHDVPSPAVAQRQAFVDAVLADYQ